LEKPIIVKKSREETQNAKNWQKILGAGPGVCDDEMVEDKN
jgi:hypothetical protein